jgi:hypothetical protein
MHSPVLGGGFDKKFYIALTFDNRRVGGGSKASDEALLGFVLEAGAEARRSSPPLPPPFLEGALLGSSAIQAGEGRGVRTRPANQLVLIQKVHVETFNKKIDKSFNARLSSGFVFIAFLGRFLGKGSKKHHKHIFCKKPMSKTFFVKKTTKKIKTGFPLGFFITFCGVSRRGKCENTTKHLKKYGGGIWALTLFLPLTSALPTCYL